MNSSGEKGGLVPLNSLTIGQKAMIMSFTFDTKDGEQEKKLGLMPGEELLVVRRGFLGDSMEIKIRGYFLALSKNEAEHIKVKILPK